MGGLRYLMTLYVIIEQIHSYSMDSKILLISPIHLGENVWENEYDPEFSPDSVKVSKGLADVYKRVSEKDNTFFLDAAVFAEPSSEDKEHLNEEGHGLLAEAVYRKVREII